MKINRDTIIRVFESAEKEKYAIPHFNHSDFWDMSFIVQAAQANNSPVMIACLPRVLKEYGLEQLCTTMNQFAQMATVPIIYHLDHCSDVKLCKQAIDAGFTSVMIDAADKELEENISTVKEIVNYAHPRGVFVEAEIGKIKSAGEEGYTPIAFKATVDDAVTLVEQTKIDSLAISIGSEHGLYEHVPQLDYGLLKAIKVRVDIPLVLHGGSGIPEKDVKKAIELGIRKVNVGTEIRYTYLTALKEALQKNPLSVHTIDIFNIAGEATKTKVKNWMQIEGSIGKGSRTYE